MRRVIRLYLYDYTHVGSGFNIKPPLFLSSFLKASELTSYALSLGRIYLEKEARKKQRKRKTSGSWLPKKGSPNAST